MDTVVEKVAKEIQDKWEKISRDNKKLSIEQKIQRVIHIPLRDVKNIIVEENI